MSQSTKTQSTKPRYVKKTDPKVKTDKGPKVKSEVKTDPKVKTRGSGEKSSKKQGGSISARYNSLEKTLKDMDPKSPLTAEVGLKILKLGKSSHNTSRRNHLKTQKKVRTLQKNVKNLQGDVKTLKGDVSDIRNKAIEKEEKQKQKESLHRQAILKLSEKHVREDPDSAGAFTALNSIDDM